MKKLIYILFLLTAFTSGSLYAQGQLVSGVVSDAKETLPGVSVFEKGKTTNGTLTDENGKFRITLKGQSGVLIFRSLGYKQQEVLITTQTNLNVVLESEDKSLDEVVVVGFGQQKKLTLTGAVSSVSGREIRENPAASLQNALAGKLPGFFSQQPSGRPGADGANFYIRGVSSYNGNNRPLIIVDDVEFSYDQFARIDPNEIESLSILKDASTTAIYGVRGANGVVVITTRRGKEGPPQISVRVETALSQPTKIPTYLNAYESAKLYNQAQINDNAANPNPSFKPRFSDQDLALYQNGTDPYGHPDVNWKDVLFKTFSKQYRGNLDLSGGTQRVKYFVSVGYLNQDGMLKDYGQDQGVNSNYYHQRYNYRSNLDMSVTKTLDLRLDLYGNFAQVNTPQVGSPFGYNDLFYDYSSFATLAPFAYPVYNPDGSLGYSTWSRNENPSYNVNNVVGRLKYYGYSQSNESNINFIGSAKQKLNFITEGLNIQGRISFTSNYAYTRSMTRDQFPSFIYNPTTNSYEARDPNVYRVRRFFIGYDPKSTSRVLNLQFILNYDRTFAKAHHVYGLALINRNSNTAANSNGIYNFIPSNFQGYSGRLGYDYKNRYLLQLNAAYNGSDRFVSDKRFGLFPAASAGWNISEEPFFQESRLYKSIDLLKIRGSYGIVGNDALGSSFSYYYQQNYGTGNGVVQANFGYSSNGYNSIYEGTLANNDVTWEKEKKLDVALEFGLFNSKLTGSIDFFDNNRYDILTTRGTISAIFGQGLPPVNIGKVNNRGYELELGYQSPTYNGFSYSIKGNYSVAKNKIVFQDEPSSLYPYQAYTGNSIGQSRVYTFIGYYKSADDIANSPKTAVPVQPGDLKYADLNNDGKIDGYDMSVTGNPNTPNTVYGINLGIRYKSISISANFQGARNFSVRGTSESIRAFASNLTAIHQQAWTPELGDNAKYPRLTLLGGISDPAGYPSTFWLIPGDYLRLRNAQVNFEVPSKFSQKIGIPQIRIYVNGSNLLTFTSLSKLYEFDPEITSGTDRVSYPPQRLINLGISATF
ncbi:MULTISPECIES: TonB-dependent receptor [unclassified Arcicella]|uniref:SusC/RagA family TonB-linked outer membrane protein n=1 Tax=unclassified Arcicella TaxID=2644986 RepID=UPI00285B9364|nr:MULTISPECIES: TonB-dependent receptor [unclassified Arcicella]MDR6562462.1 TonB-linked SusC/RagA family outer membrane protein [Arcicella sp. BE51]MDR6812195.1 TonB-linked SusC/RagA family outer membrane protein [Arcicella sp. BE140]MDR6823526.1 TonB-linked SusC/RagA family outer membrane protein [Arcicella sp. BE139]